MTDEKHRQLEPRISRVMPSSSFENSRHFFTQMKEIWKDIPGYEGKYQVSNIGRVRSLNYRKTGRVFPMKLNIDKDGYYIVTLFSIRPNTNNRHKQYRVARLVGLAFIPNPDNKPEIDHINGIRTDNSVKNLRWATRKENDNNPICLKKKSERTRGSKNPMYGKKATEEHRRKLSEAHKGIKHDEIWRRNSAMGLQKKVVQIDKDDKVVKIWDSIKEATEAVGATRGKISSICKHYKGRIYRGYKWELWRDYCKRNKITTDPQ